jgi:hypothetical protein
MAYIHDTLKEEQTAGASPADVRAHAERWIQHAANPMTYQLPHGYWSPGTWWPSSQEVLSNLNEMKKFYDAFRPFLGEAPSLILQEAEARLHTEAGAMFRLADMDEQARMKLPAHEFPPYCFDFNNAVHESDDWESLKLVTFLPQRVGGGGFADIYKATGKDGASLALKLFHLDHQRSRAERADRSWYHEVQFIIRNVWEHREVVQQEPFAKYRFGSSKGGWYLREFAEGKPVESMLEAGCSVRDKELAGKILLTYAGMLKSLHSKGLAFADNGWSNVVFSPERVTVVDYDLVFPFARINEVEKDGDRVYATHVPRRAAHRMYASREQFIMEEPLTPHSELESFARMLDVFCVGGPLKPFKWDESDARHSTELKERAHANKSRYPPNRKGLLPRHLRDVVPRLITYPRDDSITIDNIIDAIKADYKV